MKFLRRYYSQLIFLTIGILVGFFISKLPIQFEPKISWISLATFFLTILLALYLEFVVRPSLSNTRNEKDILMDQLKDIKAKLVETHGVYVTARDESPLNYETRTAILMKLRELSNLIDIFKGTDEYCKTYRKLKITGRIISAYLKYKKAMTGYKFNEPSFFFDRRYWNKQDSAYNEHMKIIIHSVIDINKAR